MSPELTAALAKAKQWHDTATPEEKEAMWELQRRSIREAGPDTEDRTVVAVPTTQPEPSAPEPVEGTFQSRVSPWMQECFGPVISADHVERGDRFLEEVLETLQSGGYDPARIAPLRDYVWGRPAGEPSQEVGGVMVTLAAYCLAHNIDMHEAGETELSRIMQPEIIDKIRTKQAAKPTGSALP